MRPGSLVACLAGLVVATAAGCGDPPAAELQSQPAQINEASTVGEARPEEDPAPAEEPSPEGDSPPAEDVAQQEDPGRLLDKTFDDIQFDIEPDQQFEREMLTPEIEALDGRHIKIRGYILPTLRKKGLTEFVLVRDNQECCFGPGAALYDCILVNMKEGETAEFSIRPVAVEGEFKIEVFKPFERVMAIYQIEGEQVE